MEKLDLQIVIVNSFPKGAYPIVYVHTVDNKKSQKKTLNDKDGGSNPKWNFSIDVAAAKNNNLILVVKLKAKRIFGNDKDIGEIRVPIKNLLDSYDESNDLNHVSSELGMNRDGKSKGHLKFSFKFGEVTQSSVAATTTTPPQQPSISDKLAKGINKWLCGFAKMAVCHAVFNGDLCFN